MPIIARNYFVLVIAYDTMSNKYYQGDVIFIKRDILDIIDDYKKLPVVAILGPRQSGKTTIAQHAFKNHTFLDLDDPNLKLFAETDPKGFLKNYENEHGIIIDEFQNCVDLLSYIKIIVDEKKRPSYFVLTGSQNFLMNEAITQSLAGRVGIVTLLPLSIHELQKADLLLEYEDVITAGFYPRVYADKVAPARMYSAYIQTYIERDVRMLTAVANLSVFQLFLTLCAGRVGQPLNIADLAVSAGIDQKTVQRWLLILEASYVIFILKPYYTNFNKRLTKTPKLYFFDTGIVSYLLGIKNKNDLVASPFKGGLFENLIIADFYKQYYNLGLTPALYFWRDQNGRIEVDCLIDQISKITSVEIKSSATIIPRFFDGLEQWNEISQTIPESNYIIYAGDDKQKRSKGAVWGWKQAGSLIRALLFRKSHST